MPWIKETEGDIFSSPDGSVLIHACNCQGAWGAGVAAAFRTKYPAAYKHYRDYCNGPNTGRRADWRRGLLGTALLIPPKATDQKGANKEGHWIACLFTSYAVGSKLDPPDTILENTRKSIADLYIKLFAAAVGSEDADLDANTFGQFEGKLFSVRLNSKLFNVPWGRSREVLEQGPLEIIIVNNISILKGPEQTQIRKELSRINAEIGIEEDRLAREEIEMRQASKHGLLSL